MSTLRTIVSFWHGPMSWLEHLSIASFRRQRHRVEVFAFDPIPGLPEGATWRDAAEVMPREKLVFYKGKGTPAVFSDQFRVMLLKQNRGIYADLDVYAFRPITGPGYIMGFERPGSVNSAVLYIPPDAPLLDDLMGVFTGTNRPLLEPYLPPMRRLEVAARRLFGDPLLPENMQYGATGPMALTHYVRQRGLWDQVQPASVFYPIPYEAIPALMQPGSSVDTAIRPETLAIHLWRSQFTNRGRGDMPPPPPGSAMAELCAREGVTP
ncbi:MAG: hypothetical protein P0Y65_10160 [Candidatus Devosia phytovorans]|uniref:Uncharacterized protein n=1 Tax=Candidatus Devosia phytovorans TaxID=3121372 RepID=A0AAJ5VX93_9HYPH|nr:hypothetical protein [Devosia sp.]WEK06581.1 MAG: hypothetical protein P0Y65_10160 [Devosia sp.]